MEEDVLDAYILFIYRHFIYMLQTSRDMLRDLFD